MAAVSKMWVVALEELHTSIKYDFGEGQGCLPAGKAVAVDTAFGQHLLDTAQAVTPERWETLQRLNAPPKTIAGHLPAAPGEDASGTYTDNPAIPESKPEKPAKGEKN